MGVSRISNPEGFDRASEELFRKGVALGAVLSIASAIVSSGRLGIADMGKRRFKGIQLYSDSKKLPLRE